jgi:RNA polymerase sporulation-specific sigma factor
MAENKETSKILTRTEELYYIRLMNEGSLEAEEILVSSFKGLAKHFAIKLAIKNHIFDYVDDLMGVASIGLIKGLRTYDINKNTRVATYCGTCIKNEIGMYIRKLKSINNTFPLYQSLKTDKKGRIRSVEDIISDQNNNIEIEIFDKIEEEETKDKIAHILNLLDDRTRIIIEKRFGFNNEPILSQQEVAKSLNLSQSRISGIEQQTIKHLRKMLLDIDSNEPKSIEKQSNKVLVKK